MSTPLIRSQGCLEWFWGFKYGHTGEHTHTEPLFLQVPSTLFRPPWCKLRLEKDDTKNLNNATCLVLMKIFYYTKDKME